MLKTATGLYAYGSQGLVAGRMQNIQVAFSSDGVHWQSQGDALPIKAAWATAQDYWAAHAIYKDERYYLFYNARTDFSGQGIGVATASSPVGPFVDSGQPLVYGDYYINIDAFAFEDVGRWWLCWGSCYQPIKLRELAPDLLTFAPETLTHELIAPEKDHPFASLHEAAWIHKRFEPALQKTFYYLYTSGADAFGLDSYGIMVARSENLIGPYQTLAQAKERADSVILRSNATFLNPGAQAIFTDDMGQEWLLYHAYRRAGQPTDYQSLRNAPRVLMLDRLEYDASGWPYTRYGSPSTGSEPAPTLNFRED